MELSDLGFLVVVGLQLLRISCNSNNIIFSLLLEQVEVELHVLGILINVAHLNVYRGNNNV